MKELKPCPFCGGEARLHVNNGVRVICNECNCQTITLVDGKWSIGVEGTAVSGVIEKWNRRVKDEVFNNSKSCSIFIPKNKKNIEKGKIVYLCDHRACKECGSGLYCNHTHKIEHAKNFIKIGDTYFEDEKE